MRPALALLLLLAAGAAAQEDDSRTAARRARQARLAAGIGKGHALLFAQPQTDALRPEQEGHFLYVTGCGEPGAVCLVAGEEAPPFGAGTARVILYRRGREPLSGPPDADTDLRALPRRTRELVRDLADLLPANTTLHVPSYRGLDDALVRARSREVLEALREARPDVALHDLHPLLVAMRARKDACERQALERAAAATVAAFREALPAVRPGSSEAEVEIALFAALRRRGARPGYPLVVAAGPRSAHPHSFTNDDPLPAGALVVIDAGARVEGYVADVTRTFPVSGRFSARQRQVYAVVLEAQAAALAAVRPGATLKAVDEAARAVFAREGLAERVLHCACHHVGLHVHDPGGNLLAKDMAIAVEPAVYLPDEGFGIRIEDTVLVTDDGARVLSGDLPRDAAQVEALLR